MNEEQLFAFDTWGFLVVEDAISPEQVAELKAGAAEKGPSLHSQHARDGGFWSQAYFDLLDPPALVPMLDLIYGGTSGSASDSDRAPYRIDHINVHTHGVFNKNFAGGTIHGGNGWLRDPTRPHELVTHFFERNAENDTYRNGLVTVVYELEDTVCNGGGFGCLAGSHKTHLPVPEGWRDLSKGVHPMVTSVPASAGSAIIFTEALQHVTLPWTVSSARTTLFYKYTTQGEAYSGADNLFDPSDADGWEGVDERKHSILMPPSAAYVERRKALAEAERAAR